VRVSETVVVDSIQAYRATDLTRTRKIFDLPLSGPVPT
jgi:hypothetical protein